MYRIFQGLSMGLPIQALYRTRGVDSCLVLARPVSCVPSSLCHIGIRLNVWMYRPRSDTGLPAAGRGSLSTFACPRLNPPKVRNRTPKNKERLVTTPTSTSHEPHHQAIPNRHEPEHVVCTIAGFQGEMAAREGGGKTSALRRPSSARGWPKKAKKKKLTGRSGRSSQASETRVDGTSHVQSGLIGTADSRS